MNTQASSIATITPNKGLVSRVADRFGVDPDKLLPALKSTAFRQRDNAAEITNEQMMALLIVSNEYGLNPFTKEIFAYPDKSGIVPVVSVDGWSRIINENPQMDGIEFEYSPETLQFKGKTCHEWIDCIIYRKDRSRPIRVREFFSEVSRDLKYASPWDTHPNRMHRHKTEIQCARIAFGFAGIYDQDEAERIIEAARPEPITPALMTYNDEQKKFFDSLITNSDDLGMYCFLNTLDEGVRISLHNSFERGTITKFKQIVSKLESDGQHKLTDIQVAIEDAHESGDDFAAKELLQDIPQEAIDYIKANTESEVRQFIDECLTEIAA